MCIRDRYQRRVHGGIRYQQCLFRVNIRSIMMKGGSRKERGDLEDIYRPAVENAVKTSIVSQVLSFFSSKQPVDQKNSRQSYQDETPDGSENSGLLGVAVKGITTKIVRGFGDVQDRALGLQESAMSYKNFIILAVIGLVFFLLALLNLPFIIFFPEKFVGLFSLGSLCFLAGLAILKTPHQFFKTMLSPEKRIYFTGYVLSLLGSLYYSIIDKSYIMALVLCVAQTYALAWLISTTIPGGPQAMRTMTHQVLKWLRIRDQDDVNACGSAYTQREHPVKYLILHSLALY
eukprot:TRINITY_DN11008_c0_g1_i1.p1 TRINITY_DN11008_c0_g1~~TRINITY_DN11008_c0_g1_i1.p1  ORF type:complete len:309 (-),score=33.44 TRINITY_DN11008_c0_g1_i1:83-949(-)